MDRASEKERDQSSWKSADDHERERDHPIATIKSIAIITTTMTIANAERGQILLSSERGLLIGEGRYKLMLKREMEMRWHPPKVEEKIGAVPRGLSTDFDVIKRNCPQANTTLRRSFIVQFKMSNQNECHQVIGIPISSVRYAVDTGSCLIRQEKKEKKGIVIDWMSKFNKMAEGIKDHLTFTLKISETLRGKLSLGARILKAGGVEKVYRRYFPVGKRERLLKASQCYLSTTSGPIAGLLFISTEKIAFRSDRSLTFASPNGDLIRVPYKVLIPLTKIEGVSPNVNVNKPNRRYIHIVTVDDFEFWFMGFVSYQRSLKYLQQVVLESEMSS